MKWFCYLAGDVLKCVCERDLRARSACRRAPSSAPRRCVDPAFSPRPPHAPSHILTAVADVGRRRRGRGGRSLAGGHAGRCQPRRDQRAVGPFPARAQRRACDAAGRDPPPARAAHRRAHRLCLARGPPADGAARCRGGRARRRDARRAARCGAARWCSRAWGYVDQTTTGLIVCLNDRYRFALALALMPPRLVGPCAGAAASASARSVPGGPVSRNAVLPSSRIACSAIRR